MLVCKPDPNFRDLYANTTKQVMNRGYPLVNDHIAGWNITICNRKYIFHPGLFFSQVGPGPSYSDGVMWPL